jgi:hypothetical protein
VRLAIDGLAALDIGSSPLPRDGSPAAQVKLQQSSYDN